MMASILKFLAVKRTDCKFGKYFANGIFLNFFLVFGG